MRPTWQDEVIGDIDGDFEPRYDIGDTDGVLMPGVKLTLKNPVATVGTRHSADRMNNLFDMDNLDSMRGQIRETTFNADGSVTEEMRDGITNALTAKRVTTFRSDGGVVETTTVYTDDGARVLRESVIRTGFPDSRTIREEVE